MQFVAGLFYFILLQRYFILFYFTCAAGLTIGIASSAAECIDNTKSA